MLLRSAVPAVVLAVLSTLPPAAAAAAAGDPGTAPPRASVPAASLGCVRPDVRVDDVMAPDDWAPLTPSRWRFTGADVALVQAGTAPTGPRRPFELAVLQTGPEFGTVQVDAEVRLDTPVPVSNRDVIIVFGYQSPTRYYYAHLSSDNTIYPHNGIFLVDDADRLRLDDQWDGRVGAPPAVRDAEWHDVSVRHCSATGRIEVFVDGAAEPLMTATDTTLQAGRIGFGSFDNIGRVRDLVVRGTPGCLGQEATVVGTERRDRLSGTAGRDVVVALGGDDVVTAGAGDDLVCGGDGDDQLLGQGGDDVLFGEAGRDRLVGGRGTDVLRP